MQKHQFEVVLEIFRNGAKSDPVFQTVLDSLTNDNPETDEARMANLGITIFAARGASETTLKLGEYGLTSASDHREAILYDVAAMILTTAIAVAAAKPEPEKVLRERPIAGADMGAATWTSMVSSFGFEILGISDTFGAPDHGQVHYLLQRGGEFAVLVADSIGCGICDELLRAQQKGEDAVYELQASLMERLNWNTEDQMVEELRDRITGFDEDSAEDDMRMEFIREVRQGAEDYRDEQADRDYGYYGEDEDIF